MCKFKLPFSERPLVSCYQYLAFPMSIIEANAKVHNEDITPWVISKFINPTFIESSESIAYDICLFDKWGRNDGILFYQYINFFKNTYEYLNVDIIKYLTMMIKDGCYISGTYNERYIPGKMAYQKSDYVHDYILYGFDENKEVFISAGYLANQRYQSYEITFSDFTKAVNNIGSDRLQFAFWKYNCEYHYQYNKERVFGELSDYISSTTTHKYKNSSIFGIEANRKLKELFLYCINNYDNPIFDSRYSLAYMEHKYFLLLCIKYIYDADSKNVSIDENDLNKANEIYKNAIIIHRLGIKMNITPNYYFINKIVNLLDINESNEMLIFDKIIKRCAKY